MKCLLVLPLVLVLNLVENCPDRWALSRVDVWTHRKINGRGEHKEAISIYFIDNHEMIEVIKANASILCNGMIKGFPVLKYLTLADANISKIEPGAFQNLPKLTHLSLAINHLTSIERYQFQNLENLRVLYLSKNEIENVEEDAFVDLVHLRKIYLDRNNIHEIDSRWFLDNQKISLIDLSFNSISKLQKGAFNLPKNGEVEIRLQKNQIEEVEPNAIKSSASEEEVPYLNLHLEHNHLADILPDFLKSLDVYNTKLFFDSNIIRCFKPATLRILKEVSVELHADNNPLSCECLETAINFVKDNVLKSTFYYSSTECQLPGLKPDRWDQSGQQNMYFSN